MATTKNETTDEMMERCSAAVRQPTTDRVADRKGSTEKIDERMRRGSADQHTSRGTGRRR
jgi:hypothetical protein